MNKTKNLLIIALAAVIMISAIGIGVAIYANSPETVMQSSVQTLIEDVFAREEFEVMSNILESGSLEMIMSIAAEGKEMKLEYKEYFGLKDYETYIEKAKFSFDDFSVDGSAYIGEDYMYVSVPSIYGDPIGIVRGKTEKEFASSLFVFDSDSDYELEEDASDYIKILCRIYDDAKDKEAVKDIKDILTSYIEFTLDSVKKHADIDKENGDVKLDGEKVSARIVKIEIDAECAFNIMSDLYEELKGDSRITKLIKKYGKLADKYLEGTSLEGELQQNLGEDADDDLTDILLEKYDDFLDDFGNEIDDIEDEIDESGNAKIVIEMATKKTSSTLLALTVEAKADGEKLEIADISFGKNGAKKTDKITASLMGGEMAFEFAVKQNDRDAYKAELTLSRGEKELASVFAKIDKDGGKFSFGAAVDSESYEVTGSYEKSGKAHTFDFKDIIYKEADGEEISLIDKLMAEAEGTDADFELKMIICESDKPKPLSKGKVKSLFTLTEDDIDDLKIAIEEFVAEAGKVFDLSGNAPELDTGIDW